jgi:crossover junction endodeoxyribonuclease RuvC
MNQIYVGIDVGLDGGIAAIDNEKIIYLHKMPVIKQAKKRIMDINEVVRILTNFKVLGEIHVAIERVGAMPKQGVTSCFNFGEGFGALQGICAGLNLRYSLVKPQTWKKSMLTGTDKSKGAAIIRTKQLFHEVDLKPGKCKTDQDGLADAIMIACYNIKENSNVSKL